MSSQKLEGRAVKIDGAADHTFVYCPNTKKYLVCWGGHVGPDLRTICTGTGRYAVADCYRGPPILDHRDTALIGVYAVNGVCHQSANCFLYSTNPAVTLNFRVRGYWLTVTAFGVYGTNFLPWLATVYAGCRAKEEVLAESPGEGTLAHAVRALHEQLTPIAAPVAPQQLAERIMQEAALVAKDAIPHLDTTRIDGALRDFLREKDRLVSKLSGRALADRINDASAVFQRDAARTLGAANYEALTGVPAGETIAIIDPAIADAAGVRGR